MQKKKKKKCGAPSTIAVKGLMMMMMTTYDTDYDVTIGQCVESDRNPTRAVLIRHKTLSDGAPRS